jgi:hypothetical protein
MHCANGSRNDHNHSVIALCEVQYFNKVMQIFCLVTRLTSGRCS